MRHVFTGRDEMDAHFVKNLLQQEGIEAVVTGDNLVNAIGTLPLSAKSLPGVYVNDADEERATLIVRELLHGPHRFTELRRALPGISPHTLTSRLRQFETYGLVVRTAYAEIPPRVVYRLTPLGEGLREVLEAQPDAPGR
jgi:hypothetical protein